MTLQVGQTALDFTLPSHLGDEVTLSKLRGKERRPGLLPSGLDAGLNEPDPGLRG